MKDSNAFLEDLLHVELLDLFTGGHGHFVLQLSCYPWVLQGTLGIVAFDLTDSAELHN